MTRVSSMELAEQMGLTASQIRQDLNHFGCFGQQGYGYNISVLREEIGKILGLDRTYNMVVIGAGNLGQALANYIGFEDMGFYVKAIFDKKTDLCGKQVGSCVIRHIDELEDYGSANKIDIAVLTLKSKKCLEVVERLVAMNVKAIWNFASFDFRSLKDVAVEEVQLSESLMMLSYSLSNKNV